MRGCFAAARSSPLTMMATTMTRSLPSSLHMVSMRQRHHNSCARHVHQSWRHTCSPLSSFHRGLATSVPPSPSSSSLSSLQVSAMNGDGIAAWTLVTTMMQSSGITVPELLSTAGLGLTAAESSVTINDDIWKWLQYAVKDSNTIVAPSSCFRLAAIVYAQGVNGRDSDRIASRVCFQRAMDIGHASLVAASLQSTMPATSTSTGGTPVYIIPSSSPSAWMICLNDTVRALRAYVLAVSRGVIDLRADGTPIGRNDDEKKRALERFYMMVNARLAQYGATESHVIIQLHADNTIKRPLPWDTIPITDAEMAAAEAKDDDGTVDDDSWATTVVHMPLLKDTKFPHGSERNQKWTPSQRSAIWTRYAAHLGTPSPASIDSSAIAHICVWVCTIGDRSAQLALASRLRKGDAAVPLDINEAVTWLRLLERAGQREAAWDLHVSIPLARMIQKEELARDWNGADEKMKDAILELQTMADDVTSSAKMRQFAYNWLSGVFDIIAHLHKRRAYFAQQDGDKATEQKFLEHHHQAVIYTRHYTGKPSATPPPSAATVTSTPSTATSNSEVFDENDATELFRAGRRLMDPFFSKEDRARGHAYLLKSANMGDRFAQLGLTELWYTGEVKADEAIMWAKKSFASLLDSDPPVIKGYLHKAFAKYAIEVGPNAPDYPTAAHHLRLAVQLGQGQHLVALNYQLGDVLWGFINTTSSKVEAIQCWSRVAFSGLSSNLVTHDEALRSLERLVQTSANDDTNDTIDAIASLKYCERALLWIDTMRDGPEKQRHEQSWKTLRQDLTLSLATPAAAASGGAQ